MIKLLFGLDVLEAGTVVLGLICVNEWENPK
jgi:hypothetical protein